MTSVESLDLIAGADGLILVTGAGGFIGAKVVENLLGRGFRRLRCFVRPSGNLSKLHDIISGYPDTGTVEIVQGNLLSKEDCADATREAAVIYHLAAARGEKSFPDAFMNSVVTTRNLLDAVLQHECLRRFVSVSSFAVYANEGNGKGNILDESCRVEPRPELRGEAYCFAKIRQDEMVIHYGKKFRVPYVIVRPGYVYGPGNEGISSRVGIGTFGLFLHLGGSNKVPLSYVDNCAEAVVLAGLKPGVDGQIFNVVDDDLPSSRQFLRRYKREVRSFKSFFVPRPLSYLLCLLWEKYSDWSEGQLPRAYNRLMWHAYWKGSNYTNEKLKRLLGWTPRVSTSEGLERFYESCRRSAPHA